MSASEKLKALEQATELSVLPSPFNVIGNHGQWASLAEPYLALRYALPQILAVVEAAEAVVAYSVEGGERPNVSKLSQPLAALEEALE